ncbi:MAG: ABC transporter ATP-binding protein [Candidatus Coatesbacteria bacterium]
MTSERAPIARLVDVVKTFRRGSEEVRALGGVSLDVAPGEFAAVVGASGSGKTTLLNMLGCMDTPTGGRVLVSGRDVTNAGERELAEVRKHSVGFVFQQFFLVPTMTVLENARIPALFARNPAGERRAAELLELVGLGRRLDHYPGQLSGGEMQRVVIARALVNSPALLLADEPTGNLDSRNAGGIMELFESLHRGGLAIVMVTHNPDLAGRAGRIVRMEDGRIMA